jgi:hypothetical protein
VQVVTDSGKVRRIPPVRLSHGKAAEFQSRGAVHFHALVRLDGVDPTTWPPSSPHRPGSPPPTSTTPSATPPGRPPTPPRSTPTGPPAGRSPGASRSTSATSR